MQATFWIDGQEFLMALNGDGALVWDGPRVAATIGLKPTYPYRNSHWLEQMRDTFRDAAKAAKELADAKA